MVKFNRIIDSDLIVYCTFCTACGHYCIYCNTTLYGASEKLNETYFKGRVGFISQRVWNVVWNIGVISNVFSMEMIN